MDVIKLSDGSGGQDTHKLIKDVFFNEFKNEYLLQENDGTNLNNINGEIIVTTDSFVVSPLFFNGGDIGKLSICGTVNDLAVSGAIPLYLTAAFIIEEGFSILDLKKIVSSMAMAAKEANVKIVAGDTKVVEKGKCDGVFINTTGIGVLNKSKFPNLNQVNPGDKIILNGTIGDHGMALLSERNLLGLDGTIKSDCACLNNLISNLSERISSIKVMRDATRGGLATTLKELTSSFNLSFNIDQMDIPISNEVDELCDMIGFDPLYVANEGKCIIIVSQEDADKAVEILRADPLGKDSKVIGEVLEEGLGKLYLTTKFGSRRLLDLGIGEMLPRIC